MRLSRLRWVDALKYVTAPARANVIQISLYGQTGGHEDKKNCCLTCDVGVALHMANMSLPILIFRDNSMFGVKS